jgi:hypothetical protein
VCHLVRDERVDGGLRLPREPLGEVEGRVAGGERRDRVRRNQRERVPRGLVTRRLRGASERAREGDRGGLVRRRIVGAVGMRDAGGEAWGAARDEARRVDARPADLVLALH